MLVSPQAYAVVQCGISLALFTHLHDRRKTVTELSAATGAEAVLLVRLLRALSGLGIVKQVDALTFENAADGEALAKDRGLRGGLGFM